MRFSPILIPPELTRTSSDLRRFSQILVTMLGFLGYFLPVWELKPTGLQLTAYDLAEWASLHPTAQVLRVSLVTSLAFRLTAIGLIWLAQLALLSARLPRLMYWPIVIAFGIGLLPPLEFLNEWAVSSNYRQQLIVAIVAWTGSYVCHLLFTRGKSKVVYNISIVLIAAGGIAGLTQSQAMLTELQLVPIMGAGPVLMAVSIAFNSMINRVEDRLPYPCQ